jgi:hypothetical protein
MCDHSETTKQNITGGHGKWINESNKIFSLKLGKSTAVLAFLEEQESEKTDMCTSGLWQQ